MVFGVIHLPPTFAKDANLLRVGIEADFGEMGRVEIQIEERFGFREIRNLVRTSFAGREEDGISGGDFLLAFRGAEQALAAEDEEAFLVQRVVMVGEA